MIKISEKKLDALDKKANATSDQSHDIHTQVGALLVHSKPLMTYYLKPDLKNINT
jgi:hypothetical protein